MSDILTTIAAVEWIVVGCLFLWRLRHWNRPPPPPAAFRNFMTSCERRLVMTNLEAVIVIAMVKNNLNVTAVANTLPMQRNTVLYHLDKIERETKLNPRHIHDLIDLLEIALEVL